MLKTRIISALILIPIFLGILFQPYQYLFKSAVILLIILGSWEWALLSGFKTNFQKASYVGVNLLVLFVFGFVPVKIILLFAVLHWIIAFGVLLRYPQAKAGWENANYLKALWGVWTLVPLYFGLVQIRGFEFGSWQVLVVLLIVWIADTAAYFVGKKFGKKPLALAISPKKTREGFYGALIAVVLFAIGLNFVVGMGFISGLFLLFWFVVTAIFSVLGDLFESMLKRVANVKDSGKLIPGHGGILDRIDSLTAAVPIFALVMVW